MIWFQNKIVFLALVLTIGLLPSSRAEEPTKPWVDPRHQNISLDLKRGPMTVFHFHYPNQADNSFKAPKALILFTGGGGGWSGWEERVCDNLRNNGYEVLGLDIHVYAQSDYDLDTLQQDFQTLTQYGLKPYGEHPPPVIAGGWSSGAEASVAIAGGPHPPPGLVGLFLFAPGSWCGYGWFGPNALGPRTTVKGTDFTDFAPKLTHLRIVQWHAAWDIVDSRAWLSSLKAPHREYDLSNAFHDYAGASDEFLSRLNEGLTWILHGDGGPDTSTTAPQAKGP